MQQLTTNTLLHGGTYRIEKVLGQGSFGITYLAVHTSLGKKVAIKEFFMKELNSRSDDGSITGLTDGSLSFNYARKFKKEAQNLARLEHPNIVRVTDCFDENGTFYYVMDYIEGENLNDYIKRQHISQEEAISIITDIAKALQYMHEEKHMLHLDLKPGNVMRRSSDGHVFLIDFGLSKHYSSDGQPETSTTIGLGTAGYAPIEQANQAKNGEFRPTIDVYALGATLYKLLTRQTPPAASDVVSDDEIIKDGLHAAGITGNVIEVVTNAMMPSVKKRTQNVSAFLSEISANNDVKSNSLGEEETIIGNPEKLSYRKKQPTDRFAARKWFVEGGLNQTEVLDKLIKSGLSTNDANVVLKELSDDSMLHENAEHILTEFDVDRSAAIEILTRIGHSTNDLENTVDEILEEIWDNAKSEANKAMLIGLAWLGGGILLTVVTGGAFIFYGAVLWGLFAFCKAAWNRVQMGFG